MAEAEFESVSRFISMFLIWQVLGICVSYWLNIITIQFLNSLGGLVVLLYNLALCKIKGSIPL